MDPSHITCDFMHAICILLYEYLRPACLLIFFHVAGGFVDLSSVLFIPPRNGPTIWEIGIPDCSAAEFFIPNPDITRENRLYFYSDFSFSL